MDDLNNLNQPVSTPVGTLPPLAPVTPTVTAEPVAPEMLPKKKSNKKIIGGILAVVLVIGVATGAFFVSKNLNQAATPNAPTSNPMAYPGENGRAIRGVDIGNPRDRQPAMEADRIAATQPAPTVNTPVDLSKYLTAGSHNVNYLAPYLSGDYLDKGGHVQIKSDGCTNGKCTVYDAGGNKVTVNEAADKSGAPAGYYKSGNGYYKIGASVNRGSNDGGGGGDALIIAECTPTTWTPDPATVCVGTSFVQKSNCNTERNFTGTKASTTWTPNPALTCSNVKVTQTGNCGDTKVVDGTKPEVWVPDTDLVCDDQQVTQTSNCGGTKADVDGTLDCGIADLSMEKLAYKDESSNAANKYKLTSTIDTVSKDQTFVYAFEIVNSGEATAEGIIVTDTLKGDNQELLTYVDGDSRCKYASSTRKVECSGMTLQAEETGTYAFRVKVSGDAVNGETIKNVGAVNYKYRDNVADPIDASLELTISTVVGCNHVCTSDDECGSGLSCDTDTGKCRKPACVEESNCNCTVERVATVAPTRRATVYVTRAPQPTVLPETGILDFPGVAAFGGGLLLAIVGILLAL